MKEYTFVIEDHNLSKEESRTVLMELIRQQINLYKTQFHAKWSKDHNVSRKETDESIEHLRMKRKEIEELFAQIESNTEMVDISFSINVKTAQDKMVESLAYS